MATRIREARCLVVRKGVVALNWRSLSQRSIISVVSRGRVCWRVLVGVRSALFARIVRTSAVHIVRVLRVEVVFQFFRLVKIEFLVGLGRENELGDHHSEEKVDEPYPLYSILYSEFCLYLPFASFDSPQIFQVFSFLQKS